MTLSSPSNATLGNNNVHTYVINDNENAPSIGFNLISSSNDESVASQSIDVNLSSVSSKNITVNYSATGTATGSGTDYNLANGTLTISPGAVSYTHLRAHET